MRIYATPVPLNPGIIGPKIYDLVSSEVIIRHGKGDGEQHLVPYLDQDS